MLAGPIVVDAGGAAAVVAPGPIRISFRSASGRVVLTEGAPLRFTVGRDEIEQFRSGGPLVGDLMSVSRSGRDYSARRVLSVRRIGRGVRLVASTDDPSGRRLVVSIRPQGRRAIRLSARPTPSAGVGAVTATFASAPGEAFHGFGGRHNAVDQRGWEVDGFLNQTNLPAPAPPGARGPPILYMTPSGPTGAYFVQSSFVSSRGYGFLSLRDELTRWRMASQRPDAWDLDVSAPALDYVVAPGSAPRAIRTLTGLTGRQRFPPRWALLPQLDRLVRFPPQSAAAYLREVRRDLADVQRHRLPLGAYRIEAWEFIPRPTLRHLIRRFHAAGIRVLLYFRAFVGRDQIGTDDPALVDEALRRGYVATHADGSPYVFQTNFFAGGAMIDFTDPAARRWWARRIGAALDLGADGFMQDFGEQVQVDMHFHDGSTGRTMHNRLPVLFHRATRQAIERWRARHPGHGEVYFFTRAGYSGLPGSVAYENATWPGDEPTDWSRSAGLAAQAPDMLNRGIAGAYGFGTDIGGYFDVGRTPTTKELFLRWAEWAALTPIFRLHGSVAAGTHTPWSYDRQTVRIYRRLSRLHVAAAPLIARLWRVAARTGMPIARPLWLAAPGDRRAARQDQEWLLGPSVLVAPVVTEGARARRVHFPRGCWVAPESGRRFRGPRSARVPAPLGTLPYFFRCGTRPFSAAPRRASGSGRAP
jgi:alpha-glucosidase (family GH31 glycosyl hydrolase)